MRIYQCSKISAEDYLLKNNLKTMLKSCPKNSMKKVFNSKNEAILAEESEDTSESESESLSPVLLKKMKKNENKKLNQIGSNSNLSLNKQISSSKSDSSADIICI